MSAKRTIASGVVGLGLMIGGAACGNDEEPPVLDEEINEESPSDTGPGTETFTPEPESPEGGVPPDVPDDEEEDS